MDLRRSLVLVFLACVSGHAAVGCLGSPEETTQLNPQPLPPAPVGGDEPAKRGDTSESSSGGVFGGSSASSGSSSGSMAHPPTPGADAGAQDGGSDAAKDAGGDR